MTDNDERIAALKARAEGMGFGVNSVGFLFRINITGDTGITICTDEIESIDTAHALLNGLSMVRGPVVEVQQIKENGFCWTGCHFYKDCPWANYQQINRMSMGSYVPGPDCPGPAPKGKQWVLMLVDKEEK